MCAPTCLPTESNGAQQLQPCHHNLAICLVDVWPTLAILSIIFSQHQHIQIYGDGLAQKLNNAAPFTGHLGLAKNHYWGARLLSTTVIESQIKNGFHNCVSSNRSKTQYTPLTQLLWWPNTCKWMWRIDIYAFERQLLMHDIAGFQR